jgi:polysaccharide chain length determinant protein (PEP-CTERM system associated)
MLPNKSYTPSLFLNLFWRHRWLVIAPLVLCILVALIVSSSLADRFQSDMLIQIIPQRVPDSYVRSTVTIRTEDRLDVVSQQVTSRTQLEQMIREFDLFPRERARLPMETVVDAMRANISVELVRSARNEPVDAFHVKFTYGDPDVATKVTQRLGTLYIDRNFRDRGALAQATNEFMKVQLQESAARLQEQEAKVARFREQHAGRLPYQLESNMQAIQGAASQRQALVTSTASDRDRKIMLERLYNDALANPASTHVTTPPPMTADPTRDAAAQAGLSKSQQLERAQATLAQLSLRLKPEHPDVVRTKRTISELEKAAAAEASAVTPATAAAAPAPVITTDDTTRRDRLQQMRAEIESLNRQIAFKEAEEQKVSASIRDYQGRIEAIPSVESAWASLTRDYDTLQIAYRALLTKSQDAKMAADLEHDQIGEQFRILDPARVPVRPIGPNRLQINAIGLAVGLALGLGCLLFLELRDSSFRTESDVHEVLALPVVALVPRVESVAELLSIKRRAIWSSAAAVTFFAVSGYVFWSMKLWKFVV